jgi:hypothetical protein
VMAGLGAPDIASLTPELMEWCARR